MRQPKEADISNFFIAGINYKKAEAGLRGAYSVDNAAYTTLLESAAEHGIKHFFVLSTCNRTEIFGFAPTSEVLSKFLCTVTVGKFEDFQALSYSYESAAAVQHFFKVATGIDSQILGDYEIVGQIKQAVKYSKSKGCLNSFLERLSNEVFACAKNVRTHTSFSGGTVSVSFAAIQYIRSAYQNTDNKNILLIGTGKIGTNTGKNIRHYFPNATLSVVNRTNEKAALLALEQNAIHINYTEKDKAVLAADIVIVATQSPEVIISKHNLKGSTQRKLFIDLSVPANIGTDVNDLENCSLIGVDELGRVNDETLQMRRREIPKVETYISQHFSNFLEWYTQRINATKLAQLKTHLHNMHENSTSSDCIFTSHQIQKTVNGMAVKLKTENKAGCYYLQALNDYIQTNKN